MMKYLICSAFARVFTVLLSVLFDMPLLVPSQILFCGLIVDLFAILVFAFEKPDGVCKKSEVAERLEHPIKSNLFWMILGVLSSVAIFIIPFILSSITEKYANAEILNYGFLSFIILQIVILIESSNDNTVFTRKIKLNVMKLLSFCLVAFSVASMFLFDAFGGYFGIAHSAIALLPFSLIPGALAFIISEMCKFFSAKKKR